MSTWPEPDRTAIPRTPPDEPASLETWLDYHRATLLTKCAGLAPEQLAQRSWPPSTLSLLGLVRHMTIVESWFHRFDSLALVYQHMIEEYARHNGHADLIRESVDGKTGE